MRIENQKYCINPLELRKPAWETRKPEVAYPEPENIKVEPLLIWMKPSLQVLWKLALQ